MFDGPSAARGNIELGIGIKSPSGRNDVTDDWYLPGGSKIQWTVDQGVQLGDGGWGVILQGHGYRRLTDSTYGYMSGSYLISPKNQTSVLQSPSGVFGNTHVSVPDVFLARAGVSHAVSPKLVAALGARLDGIPIHDLIGGSDGFRRPAIMGSVEPSISITRGDDTYSVTVPVRVYYNFRKSLVDRRLGTAGGGDLSRVTTFLRYQHRF
jgi:hypothetical protein